MDLQHAIQKHAEWLVKFRAAIKKHDKLDAGAIRKDDACDVGQWLKGAGRAEYETLGSYKECLAAHGAFHRQAGQVAEIINAGDYTKAEQMLANGGPYAQASTAVGMALQKLKKEAGL